MTPFDYLRPADRAAAVQAAADPAARWLSGGTNLVDLIKADVDRPARLVDTQGLGLGAIEPLPDGGLRLGATATNAETADHPEVRRRYPLLASALLAGATPQLRNAATNGGNLNQRTRCYYFYDPATACNKRAPGSGCAALGGVARIHAILGTSPHCIATHPSDFCVALAALQATVRVLGPGGERTVAFADYHRLPGDAPHQDNTLQPGELVVAIDLPPEGFAGHHSYLKLRDRLSYAFALVSVAVGMELDGEGRLQALRVALGGVAHKPWRRPEAEAATIGQPASDLVFAELAERLLDGAQPMEDNAFKVDLARRAIVRACRQARDGRPQSQTDKRIA